MKKRNLLFITFILIFGFNQVNSQVTTFDFTGEVETFEVPFGVSTINIVASGAQGGAEGGLGATIEGNFTVTPGETLYIVVGEEGHLQVGGNDQNSAGGGGGSFVYTEDMELLVAAGGGGGKCPYAFAVPLHEGCGGQAGEEGGENSDGTSFGGTDGEGGDAGIWGGTVCAGGGAGWLTVGGGGVHGGDNHPSWEGGDPYCDGGGGGCGGIGGFGGGGGAGNLYGGGGGGGGYSGGAGGNDPDHGGGGGSFNGGTDQVNIGSNNSGHGQVQITVLCIGLLLEPVDTEICLGEEITLNGSSETGGTVMWSDGVENGVPFIPGGVGTYTYTATSTSGTDCSMTVEVEVHDVPDIVANADPEVVCLGQELTLSGSGGAFYEWGPGDIDDDVPFVPELGTHTYTVTGEDWYGCFNTDEITVTVVESPEVTASASDDNICLGESVTLSGGGAVIYEWDMGVEDGVAFTPDEIGTFEFNVEGYAVEDGCFGEASIEITVNEVPTIESFTTTVEVMGDDGEIDITVTGGTPAYTFDWDNDGTGDFDDPEDLTGIPGGTYSVIVSDENECEATITATVDSQVGIEDNNLQVAVYPNPTTADIIINLPGHFKYRLTAINGDEIVNGTAVDTYTCGMVNLAAGTYILHVEQDGAVNQIKVVKQ